MSADLPRADSFAEDALLAHIHTTVAGAENVVVGPGDDMAVIKVNGGELLAAKDLLVEGRHFLGTASMAQIGRKACCHSCGMCFAALHNSSVRARIGRRHFAHGRALWRAIDWWRHMRACCKWSAHNFRDRACAAT